MTDIRKQFSLDWLSGDSRKSVTKSSILGETGAVAQTKSNPSLDEAVIYYSRPIMNALNNTQEHHMRLHELAPRVAEEMKNYKYEFDYEKCQGVVKHLENIGILGVEEEDRVTGNHLIRLLKPL
jgi:hypothetical protein